MLRAWRAIRQTGLLDREPLRAAWQGLTLTARHGLSLYTVAAWSARRFPHAPAVVERSGERSREGSGEPEVTMTFRQLVDRADLIAHALASRLAPGERIGLLGRNHATFVAALLATQRLGLWVVLLNTFFSGQQLLETCRAQALDSLVLDDEFLPGLPELEEELPYWTTSELDALRPGAAPPRRRGRIVILSSGSTGPPKAVERRPTLTEVLPALTALLGELRPRAHARTLLSVPLFHGHGLATLALSLAMAAPLYLFARGTQEAYWKTLTEAEIEVLVLVPTVLYRLLDTPASASPARLRTIVCGSAPLSADLARRALSRFGPALYNLYGASECGLISLATPEQLLAAPHSVGYVLPGVPVSIRRADGTAAAPGETGEVVVRGHLAGTTQRGVHTGDLGWLEASGLLTLAGRLDDLIICGGENVSPQAVEARITQLEYVRECAVTGVPSEEYGQGLAAFIVLQKGALHVTRDTVELDLRRLLPRMLRPSLITFVEALPRNALGKLARRQLRLEAGRIAFTPDAAWSD